MLATITRLRKDSKQTLGHMVVYDGIQTVFECQTLEKPDMSNQATLSRIPEGKYICTERTSEKYGTHYHVRNVDGRSMILIHAGNYYTNTEGCILIGDEFADINGDGYLDVNASNDTMQLLLQSMQGKPFLLTIVDADYNPCNC